MCVISMSFYSEGIKKAGLDKPACQYYIKSEGLIKRL